MERRLLRAIMKPAMVATWIFGLSVAFAGGWWAATWLHAKLALVIVLTIFHFWLAARAGDFARDANTMVVRAYRIVNEVPTLLMILIVILAVVKPADARLLAVSNANDYLPPTAQKQTGGGCLMAPSCRAGRKLTGSSSALIPLLPLSVLPSTRQENSCSCPK